MLDRGARSGARDFPFEFLQNGPCSSLFHVHTIAQARAKSAPRVLLALGLRPFTCKLRHKMALVTCPCVDRAGSRKTGVAPPGRGNFLVDFRVRWLL